MSAALLVEESDEVTFGATTHVRLGLLLVTLGEVFDGGELLDIVATDDLRVTLVVGVELNNDTLKEDQDRALASTDGDLTSFSSLKYLETALIDEFNSCWGMAMNIRRTGFKSWFQSFAVTAPRSSEEDESVLFRVQNNLVKVAHVNHTSDRRWRGLKTRLDTSLFRHAIGGSVTVLDKVTKGSNNLTRSSNSRPPL